MLQSLHVKNLALIDEVEVEWGKGLNIMTGETGAGKSIILGSVHLALGGKFTADLLRKDAEFGFVELVFQVENRKHLEALKFLDIYPEDGVLILSRKLMGKRSISKINGETVTQSLLKDVASILIDIHGQHEHQSLLNKRNHLIILDEYMGEKGFDLKIATKEAYSLYKEKVKELESADLDAESRKRELDFMKYELQEIEEGNLKEGEDEELEIQYRKMSNGKTIIDSLESTYKYTGLYGGSNASDYLSRGLHSLHDSISYDEGCTQLYEQLTEIDSLLNDFNREIVSYTSDMEFSAEGLLEVEDRLNTWNHLKGKYGKNYQFIQEYKSKLEEKIVILEDYDTYSSQLKKEINLLENQLNTCAMELSKCRQKVAEELSIEIRGVLEELNFLDVQFEISILKEEKISVDGFDNVGFMVSLNPGEELKPLSNVVSGGELSRIMLAIKTVMADKDQIDTLIFDEVDAGISGITASKVGEKLALIGKSRQVICITHLAQIAALADEHFIIKKEVVNGKTNTGIEKLTEETSIDELTRILGGGQISEELVTSAKQMKQLASKIK